MRRTLALGFAILTCTVGLWAHHSYGLFYDLSQRVILKGRVQKVSFASPHVRLTIETKNSGIWEAEWTNPDAVKRGGASEDTIKPSDVLEIEGSPALNPDWRVVSALREIRRPADGWLWKSAAAWPGLRVIE
jgi:hypothetical protein